MAKPRGCFVKRLNPTGKNTTESKRTRKKKREKCKKMSTNAFLSNLQSKLDTMAADNRIDEHAYLELSNELKKSYEKSTEEATAEKLQVFAEMANSYIPNAVNMSVTGVFPFVKETIKAIIRVAKEKGRCGCFFKSLMILYTKVMFSKCDMFKEVEFISGASFVKLILQLFLAVKDEPRCLGFLCDAIEREGVPDDLSVCIDRVYEQHGEEDAFEVKEVVLKRVVAICPRMIKNLYSMRKTNEMLWNVLLERAKLYATPPDKEKDNDFCRILDGKKRLKRKRNLDVEEDEDVCLGH